MKCEDCSSEARFFINAKMTPQCQPCMIESLCSAPTAVISIEAYEESILKGTGVQDGKSQNYPKAS